MMAFLACGVGHHHMCSSTYPISTIKINLDENGQLDQVVE